MGRRRDVLKAIAATGLVPVWRPATLFAAEQLADERFAAVNANLVTGHGAPRFRRFAETASTLATVLADCAAGEIPLDQATPAYDRALETWMGCQHLRFGALEEQMRDFRIEFWPDKRNRVGKQLSDALNSEREDLLDPAVLTDASVALQGFPALERLLFDDPVAPGTYGAKLTAAIGVNLATMAGSISAAWQPGGGTADMLVAPGSQDARYATVRDVTAAFLGVMATQLEFVAQRKLAAPLGSEIDKARPKLAESWRSGRSMANVTANLDALKDVYAGPDDGPGLKTLVDEAGFADLANGLLTLLERSHRTSQDLGPSLAVLVEDEAARASIGSIVDDTEEARHMVAGEVAGALGLVLGFNSLDGD